MIKGLLGVGLIAALAYVSVAVPVGDRTLYQHVASFVTDGMDRAKDSVKLDEGASAYPEADQTLSADDEHKTLNPASRAGRRVQEKLEGATEHRNRRMKQLEESWQ